jgi:hypothetical protein
MTWTNSKLVYFRLNKRYGNNAELLLSQKKILIVDYQRHCPDTCRQMLPFETIMFHQMATQFYILTA